MRHIAQCRTAKIAIAFPGVGGIQPSRQSLPNAILPGIASLFGSGLLESLPAVAHGF
jgi:hypothetical protein